MKVLIFVILLSTLNFIKFATTLNLTYILKQRHDYYEPNCLAEEELLESPIGWIYPLPKDKTDDIPKTTTRFVPAVPNNYSCNFENGNLCSHTWLLSTEKWTLKTDYGLILDTRWEGFPTLLTTNKTEKEYYEVTQSSFNFGFSVRSSGNVEILLCEGWNPKSYPCYYINFGDGGNKMVYLRKISSMEDLKKKADKILDAYKYYNVFFEDEWRNFEISYNGLGRLTLLEVFTGKTLINYKDPQPLNLLYILPRSKSPALWKIHKNQFLHTVEEGISKLGPEIETPSSILCVSLYVALCENCSMTFSVKDEGEIKNVDRIIGNKSDLKWRHIKLILENVTSDFVELYAQTTKPDNETENSKTFWAIDNVRICNNKEIKISTLATTKFTSTESEEVSCQSVLHQKWRPKKHVQPALNVFPGIETIPRNNSIELVLIPNTIVSSLSYFIRFQGQDICSKKSNKNRVKSSGFVITKDHKTVLNNLVPYTHYNIEFSYILEDEIKNKTENTLPTDVPTDEEVPKNVTIEASEFDAVFYWEKPACEHIYGPIWYLVKLSNLNNYYKELEGAESRYEFKDLEPFTDYHAEIVVARWRHNFHNATYSKTIFYDFKTTPTVSPAVRNLEAYSIDEHQVALRYDLPYEPQGIPKFVQVSWFDRLMNTLPRANVSEIKSCKLWPEKYCVDLNGLVANRVVKISVSLKNAETHTFGKESVVEVFTTHDRVPGKPSNLTYRVVDCRPDNDYCHLNISWLHPYQQNTTITSFNINLNKTISKKVSSHISELLKIYNANYQPVYNFQIKYIPYSTQYLLSVQSVHDEFKSDFVTISVKTDDIGDHIDQSPKLKEATNSTLVFKISELDPRLSATVLTAIVQDYDENKKLNKTALGLELHEYNFCNAFGDTWIAKIIQLSKESQNVVIGDGTTKFSPELKRHLVNKPLLPNTKYCLTFIVRNKYEETEHEMVYYEKEITTSDVQNEQLIQPQNSYTHIYMLFIVLLFIPAGFVLYRYIQKRKARRKRNQVGEENVYESLPFEECENCVYNNTYDKLMHP